MYRGQFEYSFEKIHKICRDDNAYMFGQISLHHVSRSVQVSLGPRRLRAQFPTFGAELLG